MILSLSALFAIFLTAGSALAAEVAEVADAVANEGFYVERGASISEQQAGNLVATMRNAGEGFSLVVLSDEPAAGATTFADNVQFTVGRGIVLVIAPETLGYAGEGDVYNEDELESALDAAVDTPGSDFDLAAAFVGQITGVPVGSSADPVPVPTTVASQSAQPAQPASEGGGNGLLWFIVIVGGIVGFLWWMSRRAKAKKQVVDENRLSQARLVIQEQLNDIANDVLAMEDEVRVADNARASRFYEQATETYNEASEALPKTDTPQGLVDLSNKLDVAIWQLDSAEAILDDKPLPERPEPKRLPEEAPPRPSSRRPAPAPAPRTTVPGPSSYQRRTTRRSSTGGGSLMDLLILAGGAMMNSRRRNTRRPNSGGLGGGLGDLFRRRSQPAPPRSTTTRSPSSSERSNPVPGPGRPASPSSSRSSSSTPRSRGGTSGRVRSGRKRRKG
jgi:hypothetical protein